MYQVSYVPVKVHTGSPVEWPPVPGAFPRPLLLVCRVVLSAGKEVSPLAVAAAGSVREALDMITAGFAWLAGAEVASVPVVVQAECLRELERVRSVQTAAHAAVLGAFDAGLGYEDDGCRSACRVPVTRRGG